jgi:hypothetical protein
MIGIEMNGQTRRSNATGRRAIRLAGALGLLLALGLVVGSVLPAYADMPPPIPHAFWGTVTLNGVYVVPGTVVAAYVDGTQKAETTVNATGAYVVLVPGTDGGTVTFQVGGVSASQTATWEAGKVQELDLTINAPPAGQYLLTTSSTAGGHVTTPGEGMFIYAAGQVVALVATVSSGYQFDRWTGQVGAIGDVNAASTYITMSGSYGITAQFKTSSSNNQSSPSFPWCFIATAVYGSPTAPKIDILREFRDVVLLPNPVGTEFVSLYYKISPPIAGFISRHDFVRTVVRVGFVDPIVAILNWSHDLWYSRERG